jgi:hypothetical protein
MKFKNSLFLNRTGYALFVLIMIFSSDLLAQQSFGTYQPANVVVGQANFTSNVAECTAPGLYGPSYVAISSKGVLAVAEQTGRKVKLWNSTPTANGTAANVVVGNSGFFCSTSPVTASLTSDVEGVAFSPDGQKLIVSDAGNNRVLIWNSVPTSANTSANVVLGQANFTTNTSGISATKFNYPSGVFVGSNGKLYVSDFNNNRVLIWNSIPTVSNTPADVVVGQTDFTSKIIATTAANLYNPWGVCVAPDGRLLVAESGHNRVLVWNTVPTSNGAAANVVIGQVNFISNSAGTGSASLSYPIGVTVSPAGRLVIGDFFNNRVMLYNSVPTVNGTPANAILGQTSFASNVQFYPSGAPNAQNFYRPYNSAFDLYGRLCVVGRDMNRALIFGGVPVQAAELGITISTDNVNTCAPMPNVITVTVTNSSAVNATGVIATGSFPAAFTYTSSSTGNGTYNPASGYWNIGTVPANSSVTLTINGIPGEAGSYTAYASILQFNQLDTNLANNGVSLTYNITTAFPFYVDGDGDTFGAGNLVSVCAVNATTPPTGYSLNNTDCNDAAITYADTDGDGFGAGAPTPCGVTNNADCNDSSVTYADADGDGAGEGLPIACGVATTNNDCNPSNASVYPGHPEILSNGVDDNCNGLIDELPYCAAGAISSSFEKISNVAFNTINNSSTSVIGYENFATLSTSAIRGTANNLSVSISNGYPGDRVIAFIDFNQNGDFSDSGELVFGSGVGLGPHTGSIAIPTTALLGPTRMRVRMYETAAGGNNTSCGDSAFGQVEDYTVVIEAGQTITSLGSTSGCVFDTITINGTNLTGATAANVKIGGNPVYSIISNTGTVLTAMIGNGTTGAVTVTIGTTTATSSATFTVNQPPVFLTQPNTPAALCAGTGSATISVSASGAATYQWYRNGNAISDNATFSGTSTSVLTKSSPAASENESTYYVKAMSAAGCIQYSQSATLAVNPVGASAPGSNSPVCQTSTINLSATPVTFPGYTMNSNSGVAFINISGTGTNLPGFLDDESEHNIAIPAFTFNGVMYTFARVGMNGVIVLGSATGEVVWYNEAMPSTANTAGNIYLAPFWDDLDVQSSPTIKTQTVGSVFIIQYTNATHYAIGTTTNSITFQVQLNLTTGAITFVYSDVVFGNSAYDYGRDATIGIQMSSSRAVMYSNFTSSLANGQSITLIPNNTVAFAWTGPKSFTTN